jgi:hypothetical protein
VTRHEFLRLIAGGSLGTIAAPSAYPHQGDAGPIDQRPATTDQRPPVGVTKAVTTFIQDARYDAIPDKAITEAKRCLIDGFGVVLAGATVHGSAIVR